MTVCTHDRYKEESTHASYTLLQSQGGLGTPSSPSNPQPGCKVRRQNLGFKHHNSTPGPSPRPVNREEPMAILSKSLHMETNYPAPGKQKEKSGQRCLNFHVC